MLKKSDLESGLTNLIEGYKSARNAVENSEETNFNEKSIGFQNGVGFYTLFNFRKVRNYKKAIKEKLEYKN